MIESKTFLLTMVGERKQGKERMTLVHVLYTVIIQIRSLGGLIKWYLRKKGLIG